MYEAKMTRREALATLGKAAIGAAMVPMLGQLAYGKSEKRPNIVLILADDLGYGSLGCYGGTAPTPNLDALTKQGVRLTQFYVSTPLCAPTRSSLMSGKYPQRTGMTRNVRPEDEEIHFGLPRSEKTLAECLKAAGYHTGHVGKWHLGHNKDLRPCARGFDEYYGFLAGMVDDYYTHVFQGKKYSYKQDEPFDEPGYITDLFTREAVSFIDRHAAEPFFLYLAYNAPHGPHQAPDEWMKRAKGDALNATIACMDDGIGKVLQTLKEKGIEDNTLFIFLSDNGSPQDVRNGGLRGSKGTVHEGGIRVPFIARWPGHIPVGKVVDEPLISMDIYATVAAVTGVKPPKDLDGKNAAGVLAGKSNSPHKVLFWRYKELSAIRRGDWKLVRNADNPVQLYNLKSDPGEKNNLAVENPEMVKELLHKHEEWLVKADAEGQAKQKASMTSP